MGWHPDSDFTTLSKPLGQSGANLRISIRPFWIFSGAPWPVRIGTRHDAQGLEARSPRQLINPGGRAGKLFDRSERSRY